jgi:hypothetical protein
MSEEQLKDAIAAEFTDRGLQTASLVEQLMVPRVANL